MLRRLRTLVSVPLLGAAMVLQSAGTPLATLAAVPQNVNVLVSTIPGGYVTVGHFVAFDVSISNGSGSTVAQLSVVDRTSGDASGSISGVLITGGSVAGQTTCSASGSLSCYAGNMANGATLSLRVIYQVTRTGTFTVDFVGTSTGIPGGNTDGGNSHGDTFDGAASITVQSEFDAGAGAQSTQGYVPDAGDTLQTSITGFGSSNPLWTKIEIPGAAVGTLGYLASVKEATFPGSSTCPLNKGCFGQASELIVNDGATLDAPMTVTFQSSNAKAYTPLSQWTILHSSTLSSTPVVLPACSATVLVNCVVSKNYVSGSKIDYVAVLLLDHNGWIRQG